MTQINSLLVRNGNMSAERAKELNEKHDGAKPHSLEIFLEYMGLTEEEFNKIVQNMVIPPHKPNFNNNFISKKAWDFDNWYREDNRKNK